MSKVLVIPDIHLKPWIFDQAVSLRGGYDIAVVLGDLVDDFGKGDDRDAYVETIDAAIRYAEDEPTSLWCYGNHDYSYLHHDEGLRNSGFSEKQKHVVNAKLRELEAVVGERYKVIHDIDGVLFSHAGVSEEYLRGLRTRLGDDLTLQECIEFTNEVASSSVLWKDSSPLWFRPIGRGATPGAEGLFQVAGHTPVYVPTEVDGILVTDTFSLYPDGRPIGCQSLVIYDTATYEYEVIPD